MPYFKKKPVLIEARQLDSRDPDGALEIAEWCGGLPVEDGLDIDTMEGTMLARFGDWVIKGVKGEFYPCKPDIFDATYDLVVEVPQDGTIHTWDNGAKCESCGEYHA